MPDLNNLYNYRKVKTKRKQKEQLFSLFEWTYFIYVILPIGLLSVYGYFYMWWANPSWINTVQLPLIHIILFIIIYTSNLRTHLEYADQLFLARNIPIMDSMIQKGVLRLLKTELIKIIFIFIMIMPYLLSHLNKVEFLLYFCLIALFNIFYSLYQHSLWHRKWISFLFFVIYVFVGFYFKPWLLISISLICIVLIVYLLKTINYKTRTFKQWLEIERKNDTKISKWLLRIATFTMKQSGIEVNKGETKFQKFMMNHGTVKKRLFKHRFQTNVLLESFIKWLNRQPTYWNYFIYIILLNSLVIIVLNLSMAIVVSIICIFIFNSVFKDLWTRFMSHQFMHLYYWPESYKTKKRLQKYLIIGYCLFLTGFMIVKLLWIPPNMVNKILILFNYNI